MRGISTDGFLPIKLRNNSVSQATNLKAARSSRERTTENFLLQKAFREGNTVYVGGSYIDENYARDEGGPARFYSLDAETGKTKWTYESEDGFPKQLYATPDRLVYIAYEDYLVGLDSANGKETWRRDTGNWVPSLAGLGDVVYYGSANTKVHAWAMKDGKSKWMYNIPGGSFNYLMGQPMFANDRMYFISQRGTVFALDLDSGEELFSQHTGMKIRAGLSIDGDSLYIGGMNGKVYAYSIQK